MSCRLRCVYATAALWASTNRFTFHFPGDSAVVHFKRTAVVQVEAGVLFIKRCVSCLLCNRNQRGNTERIRLWREGTAVVHRQGIESGKAVPPPLASPLLSNRTESRRRLRTMEKNMRQNWFFTFRHRRSAGARVCETLSSKYSHGYCEDAGSSSPFRWLLIKSSTRPGVKTVHPQRRDRPLPLFLPRSVAGWCHLSRALRRSYCCYENVKSERDPRLPCTTRKKLSALCSGCFIPIRPRQSFEFNSNVIAMSGFKVPHFSTKLWAFTYVYILGCPSRDGAAPATGLCGAPQR